MWYDSCVTYHNQVIVHVADVLLPIWHKDICNAYDDVGRSEHIRSISTSSPESVSLSNTVMYHRISPAGLNDVFWFA